MWLLRERDFEARLDSYRMAVADETMDAGASSRRLAENAISAR